MNSPSYPTSNKALRALTHSMEQLCSLGHLDGPCPYLPDRTANHLFLDGRPIGLAYRALLDAGYRRHGHVLYRTDCGACHACQIIRVPLATFTLNRSQRRAWRQGENIFQVHIVPPAYTREKAALYDRYLRFQHQYTDEPIDKERYMDFFVDSFLQDKTFELQLVVQDRLAGVGILDRVLDVLSAVYFYYDPDFAKYAPGTYAILKSIALASAWGLTYYYPGYYIAECRSMNYKKNFRPCQIKDPTTDTWIDLP